MKFSTAFQIAAVFQLASWVPYILIPANFQMHVVIPNHVHVTLDKPDLALIWPILITPLNPYPWLMWSATLSQLKSALDTLSQLESALDTLDSLDDQNYD